MCDDLAKARPICIVDDDVEILNALSSLTRSHTGWEVRTFSSATSFLQAEDVGRTMVLVTDLQMPQIDGIQLLTKVRAAGWTFPAIVVTGFADRTARGRLSRLGVIAVLDKPVETTALIAALNLARNSSG